MSLIRATPAIGLAALLERLPRSAHPRFPSMCQASWLASTKYELDSVGMAAQMAVETGWGNFPGKARPEFHNPCGLKWHDAVRVLDTQVGTAPTTIKSLMVGDNPLAHAIFANWRTGCEAHAQHLLAYMKIPLPPWQVTVDPRFSEAFALKPIAVTEWSQLGGAWAPSAEYGNKIEDIRKRLLENSYR